MDSRLKSIFVLFGMLIILISVAPVLGHGEDPEEEEKAAEVEEQHADEDDGHQDDDDHQDDGDHVETDEHAAEGDDHGGGFGNIQFVVGGIIGALLLAGGVAFLFSPRPSMMILVGLALIGATGVIHLMVGGNWGDTILLLNGIGFLVLGAVWGMPNELFSNQKRITAGILVIYTLITIVGYFATHDHYDFVAILTKVIEVPLLIILGLSAFRPSSEG